MENLSGHFQYVDTHEAMEFRDQHEIFSFATSSADPYSCYQNASTFHEAFGEQLNNTDSLGPISSPNIYPLGSYYSSSTRNAMSPHLLESLLAQSTDDSRDYYNSFQKTSFMVANSSVHFTELQDSTIVKNPVQVPPNTKLQSISDCPEISGMMFFKTDNYLNNFTNPHLMIGPGLSSGSASFNRFAPQDSMPKANLSEIAKACIYDSRSESSLLYHHKDLPVTDVCDQHSEHIIDEASAQKNESIGGVHSVSSSLAESDNSGCNMITRSSQKQVENSISAAVNSLVLESDKKGNSSIAPIQLLYDNGQFDSVGLDMGQNNFAPELWDNITMPVHNNTSSRSSGTSGCLSAMEMSSASDKGMFSDSGLQLLMDAIAGDHANKGSAHRPSAKYGNSISRLNLGSQFPSGLGDPSVYRNQAPSVGLPSVNVASNLFLPFSNSEIVHESPKEALSNSNFCSWIDDSSSINTENSVLNQSKKPEESTKAVKKRARPGESTRPRPKDRQQIQDRLKELREIVPNGAKCSIDALLDKTIKHMLFLQSVTKYANKLKQADEPKIIGEESGVVLKDNSGGVTGAGATWAYEVAGQTMVCPIIVEDLTPPGQMLVEMLCEDRGLFLEIADIIRGFGLIILKGVMETRECKIWARFLVEANREVTRMDIFLSLIQLLQQNSCLRSSDLATKLMDKGAYSFPGYHQSPIVSSS
ncbi:uncharacterized protein LOC121996863 isoform X1 [Zingiber officinale]|uniref:BHLH domain-containing protein n=3 Tax=Zingiber officinale TaxID=94328 RepID=A0A8J5GH10_ZINOF|nr:uncharacterized protein LOC121996863 isoform X1 [Zingiber officinale]XP_042406937.1 uncharacterized protein LOC121996863 isoform X1 [Zingiber officinale]XP_042406938.1 uncharacterized protein LOC121996863 isoform X1 [Zingiber officinale]XP_042406939.1 uncharacterized protein LOC121996863 isoform X1 [Zingiber officinale]XP_042406941.1 uncharacterized protein LOC121996863 isoform X1 [Zingiber officinale]XP_042406942.1 uncharacterized protein LOC121996863 isoform X1 [Zingiber officinale]XP_04